MKLCPKCQEEKPFSEFNKNQYYCRVCDNEIRREWYENSENKQRTLAANRAYKAANRAWFREFKAGLKCQRCPEDHPAAIDFHHRDPSEKENGVKDMMGWSKKKILAEIAKCDVLCANCHRKLHWEEKMATYASGEAASLSMT